ncbi:MAG: hypothetical protein NTY55_03985 [Flavobacteriia bacterium]|nr:hypothetical protein [Flavobacteriia bacterium]
MQKSVLSPAQTELQMDNLLLDRKEGQLVTAPTKNWRDSASYESLF